MLIALGGAERLVVDAAVSLQKRGHEVVMFTRDMIPNDVSRRPEMVRTSGQ